MSAETRARTSRPAAQTEREARRLGWYPGCAVTWREFLEQYPYGVDLIRAQRDAMSDAA